MGGTALRGALASVSVLLAACAPGGGISSTPGPSAAPLFTDSVIQSNLTVPWDVAVAPDGRVFVTERPGTIDVFESLAVSARRVAGAQVPGVRAMGEAGLLGLALDPDFATNGAFYVCASRIDQGEWRNQILRYHVSGATFTLESVLLRAGITAAGVHDACRLRFGPDHKLWVTTGDAGERGSAQDPASLNGKVLRMNSDGSVPSDNPTLAGASGPGLIYALGFRNPGGIAFHPVTGECFVADAGEGMQDEIDLVTAGANYGWPTVLGPGGAARGYTDPAWSSGAVNYAVAGAAFLAGTAWAGWNGSLMVATLKEQDLRRFSVKDGHAELREIVLDQKYGRLRGVIAAPDGSLLVTTSNGNGDRIIRVAPRANVGRDGHRSPRDLL